MKIKLFFVLITLFSIALNIYLYTKDEKCVDESSKKELFIYPQDHSSLDYELSYDPVSPRYTNFSLDAENIIYSSFYLKGAIIESYRKKYDRQISEKLIKNIQEIVYFINDFKIRFSENDHLSFFYTADDEKIVYLRFRSSLKRSVTEVYLFETIHGLRYVTNDGEYLQPCMTNGPFSDCPDVRFLSESGTIVPVFDVRISQNVKLPFLAKLTSMEQTRNYGGEAEFIYSNYATRAVLKGLGSMSKLKKNSLYKKDAVIGKSGFILEDGHSGIIYYLRKKDNTPVSPFVFHHIEKLRLHENYQQNFMILRNFYSRQLNFAKDFEKQYY